MPHGLLSPRDRVAAALSPAGGRDIPAVAPYLTLFLRDHWDEITDLPWWTWGYGTLEHRCEVLEAMADATGVDWASVAVCQPREWFEHHAVDGDEQAAWITDRRTGDRQRAPRPPVGGHQYQSSLRRPTVTSVAEVKALPRPATADEIDGEGRLEFMRAARRRVGDRLCLLASIATPLWGTHGYLGFNAMMTYLVEKPDVVEALVGRITAERIAWLRAYGRAGVDCVWIEDCLTSGDLISPQSFARLQAPHVAQMVRAVHDAGMACVYYFCGDPWDRFDAIVDTGADAVSFEESKKGFQIDIEGVVDAVGGRCAVLGNLDAITLLEKGTRDELRREIERQVQAGRRTGRFLMSLGSPVTPRTPTARVKEYAELVRELAPLATGPQPPAPPA